MRWEECQCHSFDLHRVGLNKVVCSNVTAVSFIIIIIIIIILLAHKQTVRHIRLRRIIFFRRVYTLQYAKITNFILINYMYLFTYVYCNIAARGWIETM